MNENLHITTLKISLQTNACSQYQVHTNALARSIIIIITIINEYIKCPARLSLDRTGSEIHILSHSRVGLSREWGKRSGEGGVESTFASFTRG